MKLITAIIRPHKLDEVRAALVEIGLPGLTVTEVKGFGRQKGHSETYRSQEYEVSFNPKLKLEIAVVDEMAELCTDAIVAAANSGKVGDGKIFVTELANVIRIRTGETSLAAI